MTASTRPLYARLLRLRHLRLSPAATFVLLEGSVSLAVLLALAEIVSGWEALAVPVAVAVMVKFNDMVAGILSRSAAHTPPRLAHGVAVGRSPMPRPSRVTTWIEADDAVADPDPDPAPGGAAARAFHPSNARRPQPGVWVPEPMLPAHDAPGAETDAVAGVETDAISVRPGGVDGRGRLNKGRFTH